MARTAIASLRLPELGQPEWWYLDRIHEADAEGDKLAHDAFKVGQYLTLALQPKRSWRERRKLICHAWKRHCLAPGHADSTAKWFYRQLSDLMRINIGQEMLRIASVQDDLWAARVGIGQDRESIADEAEDFFNELLHFKEDEACPPWLNGEDLHQIHVLRDQWV